jgi:hypothetical protein
VWWKYPPSLGPPTAVFCKIRLDVYVSVGVLAAMSSGVAYYFVLPDEIQNQPADRTALYVLFGVGLSLAAVMADVTILSVLERIPFFGEQFRIHRNGVSESQGSKSEYILYDEVTHISHHVTDHAKKRFIDVRILSVNKSVRGTFSVVPGSRKEAAVLALVKRLKKPY